VHAKPFSSFFSLFLLFYVVAPTSSPFASSLLPLFLSLPPPFLPLPLFPLKQTSLLSLAIHTLFVEPEGGWLVSVGRTIVLVARWVVGVAVDWQGWTTW
jgi:hypothetical protein